MLRKTYWILAFFALVVVVLPLIRLRVVDYILSVLTFVFIYTTLGQSWNVLGGYAKLFSLGHATFFGLGAFMTAFLCNTGLPSLLSLVTASLGAAFVSLPLGIICFSAKGPYFTIITLASAEIFRIVFLWRPELSGSEGVVLPSGFFSGPITIYYLTLVIAAVSIIVAYLLRRSALGLSLQAIGDDEQASAELGVNIRYAKSVTFFMSAAICALAGGSYALLIQYLSPNDVFSIVYSLDAIFVCMIGGVGTPMGPLLGALLFSVLEETLNPLLPGAHLLFLGFILIAIMFMLPAGLLSLFHRSGGKRKQGIVGSV
jgi:branched-chain amino acid transport system permease protein